MFGFFLSTRGNRKRLENLVLLKGEGDHNQKHLLIPNAVPTEDFPRKFL